MSVEGKFFKPLDSKCHYTLVTKIFLLFFLCISFSAQVRIEDNSFLLEEAFNKEWGVYQFTPKYQTQKMPDFISTVLKQRSPSPVKFINFPLSLLSVERRPLNQDGFLVVERIGLIVPTERIEKGARNGVYGVEVIQSATLTPTD